MAKKKQDVDFDEFEDEAEGDEYAEGDDDEYEDDDYEDDEDGGKKGGLGGILLVVLLGVVVAGAGAYYFMSGGNLSFLGSVPFVGKLVAAPSPIPTLPPLPKMKTHEHSAGAASASANAVATAAKTASGSAKAQPGPAKAASAKTAAAAKKTPTAKVAGAHAAAPAAKPHAAAAGRAAVAKPRKKPARVAVASHARGRRTHAPARHRWVATRSWRNRHLVRRHHWIPARRTGAGWTVQVGAFSEPGNATRLIASLRARGYQAFSGSGAGVVGGRFSVFSNTVDTEAKAAQLARQFKAAGRESRVVRQGRNYAVSLGTFTTQEAASELVSRLNARGLFATVSGHAGTIGRSHGPNRVMVGHYASYAEAAAAASRLRSQVGAAIVVRQ